MDTKRIVTLCLIVLADMLGAMAIIPIIPVFVLGQFHATSFQTTLVIGLCRKEKADLLLGHITIA